jgi:hypothetical protein
MSYDDDMPLESPRHDISSHRSYCKQVRMSVFGLVFRSSKDMSYTTLSLLTSVSDPTRPDVTLSELRPL